jgi:DUF1365 family protein
MTASGRESTTASAIYEGTIRHRRFAVREHAFTHRVALAYLDLDELPSLLGGRLVSRRPGLIRFRRSDYLGEPSVSLRDAVSDALAGAGGSIPEGGRIRLLTQLRTFGHCFNPVSFYYCFDRDQRLHALVAEVTSTPWGERHAYVLTTAGGGTVLHGGFDKRMHVSPFMGMDQRYDWRAATPGPTLSVHIENQEAGRRAFDATLSLRRVPLTARSLACMTARYPAGTLRVLALIYGHAAALKLKGVPVYRRPEVTA